MAKLMNHRQEWTSEEENILVDAVCEFVEDGKTQRDAIKMVSDLIGRTNGAVEYHWKKIRKDDSDIMDRFQGAVTYRMQNDPQFHPHTVENKQIEQMIKGAKKTHEMIQSILSQKDQSDQEGMIRSIHQALDVIKPNEPGYMMARGMIVMMYHMGEILDRDIKRMIDS